MARVARSERRGPYASSARAKMCDGQYSQWGARVSRWLMPLARSWITEFTQGVGSRARLEWAAVKSGGSVGYPGCGTGSTRCAYSEQQRDNDITSAPK